ncbi:MAG TPA: M28 family peptidase [Planctomycetota bacterium]
MLNLLLSLLSGTGGDAVALERALAVVDAGDVCADVAFLASDELEGRDTPSQGLRLAARYLRARVERLGFRPSGDQGFFDLYTLERSGYDLGKTGAWLETDGQERALVLGRDYAFFGGGEHELAGPVVFVGAASEADLAGLDLAGKWALVLDASRGRGREAWEERRARQERLVAARALGTLSVIDATGPEAEQRDERLAQMASFVTGGSLRTPGADEPARGPEFPGLSLASGPSRELLRASPKLGTELGRLRERRVRSPKETLELENVAALWPGSDPVLGREVLVLSAHYDHVGVSGGEIYNGADDNGSGTSTLLAVADALAQQGPLRRSVLLLWVSGEEKGLLGSEAWTKAPTLPEGHRAVCNLNIDMVGRNAPDKLLITPSKDLAEYNGLTRLAERLAPLEGFPVLGSADQYWERSDHMNFAVHLKIPVAFLFSDVHEDYHRPTDDIEKIDCDKIRRVARLVLRLLDGLQEDALGL